MLCFDCGRQFERCTKVAVSVAFIRSRIVIETQPFLMDVRVITSTLPFQIFIEFPSERNYYRQLSIQSFDGRSIHLVENKLPRRLSMKLAAFALVLTLAAGAAECFSQDSPVNSPPEFQIVKYSWSKDRIDWEGDPLRTPVESYREMTSRVRTERRQGTALEERLNRATKEELKEPSKPPRYAFGYKLQVNNAGTKTIREIDWDYIFLDEVSGEELGRRQFTSVEKVSPGKRKELVVRASAAPSNRISVYSLGKDEHKGMIEKVLILRLLYDDGTSWTHPEMKEQ